MAIDHSGLSADSPRDGALSEEDAIYFADWVLRSTIAYLDNTATDTTATAATKDDETLLKALVNRVREHNPVLSALNRGRNRRIKHQAE